MATTEGRHGHRHEVDAADAPALTADAALMLVDTALQQAHATGGASRAEVETAIADLVASGAATKLPDRAGIILRRPPAQKNS